MPSYWRLKYIKSDNERARIIGNLEKLRRQLKKEIPNKTAHSTLILGTWNIRNFDDNRFGNGPRLEESLWYITEIISAFDILAVQEICEDLEPLEKVMRMLDPEYDYIITDITEGPGGNRERLGFIYNRDKVKFKGVAGEIVLPFKDQISDATKKRQFARTPFACSFQSEWFQFMFATVHIYYGESSPSSPEFKRRVKEIEKVANFLARRAKKEDYNYVLVGDFNIEDFEGETFDALEKSGFNIARNKRGSNSNQTKFYDQISFMTRENELQYSDPENPENSHDVFNFFKNLFTPSMTGDYTKILKETLTNKINEAETELKNAKKKKTSAKTEKAKKSWQKKVESLEKKIQSNKKLKNTEQGLKSYYREWRTYQLSDHMPLWVELKIDFSEDYLKKIKTRREKEPDSSILPN